MQFIQDYRSAQRVMEEKDEIVFVDMEASGLCNLTSYPISIGWGVLSDVDFMRLYNTKRKSVIEWGLQKGITGVHGNLIRPEESWRHWDEKSAKVHQITQDEIRNHGISVDKIREKLKSMERKIICSWDFLDQSALNGEINKQVKEGMDVFWLKRLCGYDPYKRGEVRKAFEVFNSLPIILLDARYLFLWTLEKNGFSRNNARSIVQWVKEKEEWGSGRRAHLATIDVIDTMRKFSFILGMRPIA